MWSERQKDRREELQSKRMFKLRVQSIGKRVRGEERKSEMLV